MYFRWVKLEQSLESGPMGHATLELHQRGVGQSSPGKKVERQDRGMHCQPWNGSTEALTANLATFPRPIARDHDRLRRQSQPVCSFKRLLRAGPVKTLLPFQCSKLHVGDSDGRLHKDKEDVGPDCRLPQERRK